MVFPNIREGTVIQYCRDIINISIIIIIFIGQRIPGSKMKIVEDKFKYYVLDKNGGYITIKIYSEP